MGLPSSVKLSQTTPSGHSRLRAAGTGHQRSKHSCTLLWLVLRGSSYRAVPVSPSTFTSLHRAKKQSGMIQLIPRKEAGPPTVNTGQAFGGVCLGHGGHGPGQPRTDHRCCFLKCKETQRIAWGGAVGPMPPCPGYLSVGVSLQRPQPGCEWGQRRVLPGPEHRPSPERGQGREAGRVPPWD